MTSRETKYLVVNSNYEINFFTHNFKEAELYIETHENYFCVVFINDRIEYFFNRETIQDYREGLERAFAWKDKS
jgi:hypothetical protein